MKTRFGVLAMVIGAGLGAQTVGAAPRAAEGSGMYYAAAAQNLNPFHLGVFYRNHDRNIEVSGRPMELDIDKAGMFVAYDLSRWISVYGLAAYTEVGLSGITSSDDQTTEFGGGAWVNLLDHDLTDGLLLENRLRLQAIGQVTTANAEAGFYELNYTEYYGALTLSVVCELVGKKEYWPEAIGLYAGPAYNNLDSSDFEAQGENFGFAFGLDFYLTRKTTLSVGLEKYDDEDAGGVSLGVRL